MECGEGKRDVAEADLTLLCKKILGEPANDSEWFGEDITFFRDVDNGLWVFIYFFLNLRLRVLLQNESIKNITFLLFQHGRGGGPVMSLPRKEKRIEDSSWKYRRQLSILQIKSSVRREKPRLGIEP